MSYKERRKTIITMENLILGKSMIITESSYGTARYGCGVMDLENYNINSKIVELINCKEYVDYEEDEHESFEYSSPSHGQSQGMQYNWCRESFISIDDKRKPALAKIKYYGYEVPKYFIYKQKDQNSCWIEITELEYYLMKNLFRKFNTTLLN